MGDAPVALEGPGADTRLDVVPEPQLEVLPYGQLGGGEKAPMSNFRCNSVNRRSASALEPLTASEW